MTQRLVSAVVVIGDYEVREGMYYTKEHEWMKIENEKCRVGITDYAQKTLHEVVYVDLPTLGRKVTQNAVVWDCGISKGSVRNILSHLRRDRGTK